MIPQASIWPALHDAADKGVFHLVLAGAPISTTGIGVAGKGCLLTNTLNGDLYINRGTALVPSWGLVTSALAFDVLSFGTNFSDGLGTPLADVFPSITLPGSGVRIFGNGLAAVDSGVTVAIGPDGPIATMQVSSPVGSTIALGAGLSGSLVFKPSVNGPFSVTAVVSMVTNLLNRKFFLGFVGAAPDGLLIPAAAAAANINIAQPNMAGILMDSAAIDGTGLYTPSNKLNATPVVLGSLIATQNDFPAAGTYTSLTVAVDIDGTVILSQDGVPFKTLPQALDPATAFAPVLMLSNGSVGTKQMNVKFFLTLGSRG